MEARKLEYYYPPTSQPKRRRKTSINPPRPVFQLSWESTVKCGQGIPDKNSVVSSAEGLTQDPCFPEGPDTKLQGLRPQKP